MFRKIVYISVCITALLLAGCSMQKENLQPEISDATVDEKSILQEEQSDGSQLEGGDVSMLNVLQAEEGYTVYELSFAKNEMKIYGNLYLPNMGKATYPTVIIGHGFGGSYSELAAYAQVLARNGFAAYVFDFCGGSSSSLSDGTTRIMSVLTEVQDMEVVMDGLKNYSAVDKDNLFLMGESQGGLVASLVGVQRMSDIQGLALLYPAYVIPDDAREAYPSREDIPETVNWLGVAVGRNYFDDVWDMDVYQEIAGFDKSVLIIHGNADSLVPISYSQQAAGTFADAELIVFDGAGHGFYGSDQEKAAAEIVRFLQEKVD